MIGRGEHHPCLVGEYHGLQHVDHLRDVRHAHPVGVPGEDVEVERREDRVALAVLLCQEARGRAGERREPCAPLVDHERERAAIHFAEKMALDHHNIGDDDVAVMRSHFTDAEFLELAMMTGQYIGFGRVLAMLQLEIASCPI